MKNVDLSKLSTVEINSLVTECKQELQFRSPGDFTVFPVVMNREAKYPATGKQFDYLVKLAEKVPGCIISITKEQACHSMFKGEMSRALELLKEGIAVQISAAV